MRQLKYLKLSSYVLVYWIINKRLIINKVYKRLFPSVVPGQMLQSHPKKRIIFLQTCWLTILKKHIVLN